MVTLHGHINEKQNLFSTMEKSYWSSRWRKNKIGFHASEADDALTRFWHTLGLPDGTTVFVPLCGKSLDMLWLVQQGHYVKGVEFVEKACVQFFSENGMKPKITSHRFGAMYASSKIILWAADVLKLPNSEIAGCDAIYDRAALVALPSDMRIDYINKIADNLKPGTPYLLVVFEYDENIMQGPPFSIREKEIHRLFDNYYTIRLLSSEEIIHKLEKFKNKGLHSMIKKVYLLHRK